MTALILASELGLLIQESKKRSPDVREVRSISQPILVSSVLHDIRLLSGHWPT